MYLYYSSAVRLWDFFFIFFCYIYFFLNRKSYFALGLNLFNAMSALMPRGSPLFEAILFALVKEVCLGAPQVDDLRAAVPVLYDLGLRV